jgi:hypothetical protein
MPPRARLARAERKRHANIPCSSGAFRRQSNSPVVPPFFVPKARFAAPGSIEHDLGKKTDADCQQAIFIAPPPIWVRGRHDGRRVLAVDIGDHRLFNILPARGGQRLKVAWPTLAPIRRTSEPDGLGLEGGHPLICQQSAPRCRHGALAH